MTAGILAGSIALVGFGFDSWIEVAAAAVVLVRLRGEIHGGHVEKSPSAPFRRPVQHSKASRAHASI